MALPELKRILVAVKPWERGLPLAARHARSLAQSVDGEILLVSAVFDSHVAAQCARGETTAEATQARMVAGARVELERLAHSMRDWGVAVTTRVLWEAPAYQAILHVAREWRADLLAVGVHDQPPPHTRLTDTDWQLMRQLPCLLLLVKQPVFVGYRTVLAAVDPVHAYSEASGLDRAVLETAHRFKLTFDSALRIVHAFPDPAKFGFASAVEVSPGTFYGAENALGLHRCAVEELASSCGVTAAAVDVRPGEAVDVIGAVAAEHHAELVIVGALQRRSTLQALLGSTAEALVAELPCDVLLVPPPQHGDG